MRFGGRCRARCGLLDQGGDGLGLESGGQPLVTVE